MLSYWEKDVLQEYDHIIVGAGIVGLSTAISLKEAEPKASVLVLERGLLPTGASTKNAGFACIGSLTELLDDLQNLSEAEVIDLLMLRRQGLQLLRERIGDKQLQYLELGSYELLSDQELPALERMQEINDLLAPHFDQPVFYRCDERIESFGFNKNRVKALVGNNYEGQIHTGMMMKGLMTQCRKLDIHVITGAEVIGWQESATMIRCFTKHPLTGQKMHFVAEQLSICTNAFSKSLLPELDLQPGRGQVLVTEPITNLPFKGVFHFEEGYYYFRNHGHRVIFGGGRNLDFEGEATTSFNINTQIISALEQKLRQFILPNTPFQIADTWTGIMAFGKNKVPVLERRSPRLCIGLRLGGMGVAIGSILGQQLANLVLSGKEKSTALDEL